MNYFLEGEELVKKAFFQLKVLFIPFENNDYKPKFLQSRILLYCVIFLLLLRIATVFLFIPFSKNIFFADITKSELVNVLNKNRQSIGLNSLTENELLNKAALLKAQDMVQKEYFAHQSPSGVNPWHWFLQVGYNYKYAGENLAVGFINSSEVFNAWFNSPSHKANLFNENYKDVGTAILPGFGNNNAIVIVQIFGSLQTKTTSQLVVAKEFLTKPAVSDNTLKPLLPKMPVPTTVTQASEETINGGKFLGRSTIQSKIAQTTGGKIKNSLYAGFLNFIVHEYEKLIPYTAYVLLVIVSMALLLNILINFNIQREQLILRSTLLVAILYGVTLINKDIVALIIPHQLVI